MTLDFDRPWLDYTYYVYELYAADGTCLYVGCTWRLGGRLQNHSTKPWWSGVARVEANTHQGLEAGRRAEKERIQLLNPVHNSVFTEHPAAYGWARRRAKAAQSAETSTQSAAHP